MRAVCRKRWSGVADAQEFECLALPFPLLAPVVAELDRRTSHGEGSECTTGVDLGQLPKVADEHELALGTLHVEHELMQVTSRNHAGLVDHDNAAGRQPSERSPA